MPKNTFKTYTMNLNVHTVKQTKKHGIKPCILAKKSTQARRDPTSKHQKIKWPIAGHRYLTPARYIIGTIWPP